MDSLYPSPRVALSNHSLKRTGYSPGVWDGLWFAVACPLVPDTQGLVACYPHHGYFGFAFKIRAVCLPAVA